MHPYASEAVATIGKIGEVSFRLRALADSDEVAWVRLLLLKIT
jgi:hypothetical protein